MPEDKKIGREEDILQSFRKFESSMDAGVDPGKPINITVSDDRLKVWARVKSPIDLDRDLTEKDLLDALYEAGVVYGIDNESVRDIFVYGSFEVMVPVAFGNPPEDGVNAQIDFLFNTTRGEICLEEDEKGNVDHRELNIIECVERGTVLVQKIDPREGKPGRDVKGKEIPSKEGRDIDLPAGENTASGSDGKSLIATIAGQPIFRDDVVFVSPVYEVPGDVDYGVGNIDFEGSVLIHGNVQSEFSVRAADDVQIKGNVEKAYIEAGGNVIVNGGLYGMSEGYIKAADSVIIRSVEMGTVEANKNITLLQASRHSTLIAGEDIYLDNPKGSILGGKMIFGKQCRVSELGSTSFTETLVEIGLGPETYKLRNELERSLDKNRKQITKLHQNIKTLFKLKEEEKLTPEKEQLLKKHIPAYHQMNAVIEDKSAKLEFLKKKIDSLSAGRARISGTAHPGVKIITPNGSTVLKDECFHCTFHEHKGEVILGPF